MKSYLLISYVFVLFLLFSINSFSQIQSNPGGGLWNDPNTWIGGVVPGGDNDVIIDGPVIQGTTVGYTIYPEYCNHLTITSNGSLTNTDYGGGTGVYIVNVFADVINNGQVYNSYGDLLKLHIRGNLTNNGDWNPYETEFYEWSSHNLELGSGKSFGGRIINNANASLNAVSDMLFTTTESFDMNGAVFNLDGRSIEARGCLVYNGTFTGDFIIKGTFQVNESPSQPISFVGDVTVADTLTNADYSGGSKAFVLTITGSLTNDGVVQDRSPDDFMDIRLTGDLINNGVYKVYYTKFTGTQTQNLTLLTGKTLNSRFIDEIPSSDIFVHSDLIINGSFNLNGDTLDMNNHLLEMNGDLSNGTVFNALIKNGVFTNITTYNGLTLSGTVILDEGNTFYGYVSNVDTLKCNSYGGGSRTYTLNIEGEIVNWGSIESNSDDGLILNITGNMHNNGGWTIAKTVLNGSSAQNLFIADGKTCYGDFESTNSVHVLYAQSPLTFEGNFNLGGASLEMDDNPFRLQPDKWLYNGSVKDIDLYDGRISNLKLSGTTVINKTVEVENGVTMEGRITIQDTLMSTPYSGGTAVYTINLKGNITNNGAILNNDEVLKVYTTGNIINKGTWNPEQNYLLFTAGRDTVSTLTYYNTTASSITVNGTNITGAGSAAYTIVSGGGTAVLAPNDFYEVQIKFAPTGGDSVAQLTINCPEMLSFNSFTLIGSGSGTVGVKEDDRIENILPKEYSLSQNYPNPFNPSTMIKYSLPKQAYVTLTMHNTLGQQVATLVNERQNEGYHEAVFSDPNLPSGVYFYRLQAGKFTDTKKLLLVK
jgi:hypothetical protein